MSPLLSFLAFIQANAAALGLFSGLIGAIYAARNTELVRRISSALFVRRSLHDYRRKQIAIAVDPFFVSATGSTPEVDFRFLHGKLSIRGRASGAGMHDLFERAAEALAHFLKLYHGPLEFVFELDHFTSMYHPDIVELVRLLAQAECTSVIVRWKYHRHFMMMLEIGVSLQDIFNAERRKARYIFSCVKS